MAARSDENAGEEIESVDQVRLARRAPLPLDQNPFLVYLGTLSRGSEPSVRNALKVCAKLLSPGTTPEDLAWHRLRYQHVALLRRLLVEEEYRPATVNQALAAVRGVLKQGWLLKQMSADDYARCREVKMQKTSREPSGRRVEASEFKALFDGCDDGTVSGARDAALIAVLYGCGLRRAEAVALDVDDFHPPKEIAVRAGKGGQDRRQFLPVGTRRAVAAWLAVRGREPGPLFLPVNKGQKIVPRRMTPAAVRLILRRRAVKVGIREINPHDCRRSLASDLLDAGEDLSTVQRTLAHANPATTVRYDLRDDRTKERASEKIHVPFREKQAI